MSRLWGQTELSEKMLRLACAADGVEEGMRAIGLLGPTDMYRLYLTRLAGTEERAENLATYWAESRKERLAALSGPYSAKRRMIPGFSACRSKYLDELHSKCGSSGAGMRDPVIDDFIKLAHDSQFLAEMRGAIKSARVQSAISQTWSELLDGKGRGSYEEILLDCFRIKGYECYKLKRGDIVFRKKSVGLDLDLTLVLNVSGGEQSAIQNVLFGFAESGARISSVAPEKTMMSSFSDDSFVPGILHSTSFEKSCFDQAMLAVRTTAELAEGIIAAVDR